MRSARHQTLAFASSTKSNFFIARAFNACASGQNPAGYTSPRRLATMTVEICKPIRDELAECVLRSNCVLRENRTVQDCIKNPQDLPEQCRHLMTSFSNCKRGLVSHVVCLLVCCLSPQSLLMCSWICGNVSEELATLRNHHRQIPFPRHRYSLRVRFLATGPSGFEEMLDPSLFNGGGLR